MVIWLGKDVYKRQADLRNTGRTDGEDRGRHLGGAAAPCGLGAGWSGTHGSLLRARGGAFPILRAGAFEVRQAAMHGDECVAAAPRTVSYTHLKDHREPRP